MVGLRIFPGGGLPDFFPQGGRHYTKGLAGLSGLASKGHG